jgi:hypothetical protein
MVNVETMVRTYKEPKRFARDARRLSNDGWRVVNTVERHPRAGCLRILLLWWFVLLLPPKPELIVTYERERPAREPLGMGMLLKALRSRVWADPDW